MKLLEYEAKEYFKKYGIPTPAGKMVTSPEGAKEYTAELGKPVVIKVQLPVGGRGKAGGVKFADTPEEVAEFLVDRARKVTGSGQSIMWLTNSKVIWRFMTGFQRKNRHIPE